MAQLRGSTIDGNLEVAGNIILKQNNDFIQSVHPETGELSELLHMSALGNTIIGYGGYVNQNGNSHIYGKDVACYVGSADADFRPYYRAGDVLNFNTNSTYIRTVGYVTSSSKNVVFTIPLSKPIIGSVSAQVSESDGFVLRQNNSYTHGSDPSTFAKPVSYEVLVNPHVGLVITAIFDVATNVTNNSTIGIYWSGAITLS